MDSNPVTINCSGFHEGTKKSVPACVVDFLTRLGVWSGILSPRISAAVLAGGDSSRLGRNKALLPLQGATIIEKVINQVRSCVSELLIITNSPDEYAHLGYPCCGDVMPGGGPLSGIHAALSHCGTQYVLVVSCDIPMVTRGLFEKLIENAPGHDIVIFKHKHFEPLCALYRRTCLPALEDLISHGEYRIIDLFPTLKVKVLRIDSGDLFKNINTDTDYESVRAGLVSSAQDSGKLPDGAAPCGRTGDTTPT
jgi:molybdopterin-guanine dinucleotide biosynthesis protein A